MTYPGPATWLVVLFAVLTTHAAAHAARPAARLSGEVVDTDTGAPLPGVRISVSRFSSSSSSASATVAASASSNTGAAMTAVTDAMGRYAVTSLDAGAYVVTASKPAYTTATFGRLHAIDTGGAVDVLLGQDRNRVDFQLCREAVLAGRIIGPKGQGLADLLVTVSRPHVVAGRRQLVSFGNARSDANGDYHVGGLLTGDYYISVSLFEGSDSRAAKYAPTFYPGSADIATALRVRLQSGTTVRIDPITPRPVPWTRLTGQLKSADGRMLHTGALIIQPRDSEGLSLSPDAAVQFFPDGRFSINFVVPGHYIVRAHGSTGTDEQPGLSAAWSVDVAGTPIAAETMTLKPGSEWSGVVRFDTHGTPAPDDLAPILVRAPLADGTEFGAESEAHLHADLAFHLRSVDAGRTLIRVDGLPFPWSVDRVMQGERDVTDAPIDIVQGQKLPDLQIAFTDVVIGLTGVVQSHPGVPLANYLVVVFPADRTEWLPLSRRIQATRTDWDGHYRLAALPPGAYRVAAVNDFDEADIHERDTLDQISPRSVPVVLVNGELQSQDLMATMGHRSGGSRQSRTLPVNKDRVPN